MYKHEECTGKACKTTFVPIAEYANCDTLVVAGLLELKAMLHYNTRSFESFLLPSDKEYISGLNAVRNAICRKRLRLNPKHGRLGLTSKMRV